MNTDRDSTVKGIAMQCFGIVDLTTRYRDCLDFYDIHVGSIKSALDKAYEAGYNAAQQEKQCSTSTIANLASTPAN